MTTDLEVVQKDWTAWNLAHKGEHPFASRARVALAHVQRAHVAFSSSRYGSAHRSIKRAHDRIANIGNTVTGPPGSSPQGGFMSAVSAAHSHLAAAMPLVHSLATNPALTQHINTVHQHLGTAAQHLTTAVALGHQLAPLLMKDEASEIDLSRFDEVAEYLTKASAKGGAHTPEGEHRAAPLKRYWTHGGGADKIGWGSPGDFDRCVAEVSKHMDSEKAKGYCNERHHDALGIYPATHAKLDRAGHGNVKKEDALLPSDTDLREWVEKDWATWDAAHKGEKLSAQGAHEALKGAGFKKTGSTKTGTGPYAYGPPGTTHSYKHASGIMAHVVENGSPGKGVHAFVSKDKSYTGLLAHLHSEDSASHNSSSHRGGATNAQLHEAATKATGGVVKKSDDDSSSIDDFIQRFARYDLEKKEEIA